MVPGGKAGLRNSYPVGKGGTGDFDKQRMKLVYFEFYVISYSNYVHPLMKIYN